MRGRTAVLVAAALYALPASAQAAQGDVLRVLRPDRTGTACAVRGSSGIAFDGRRLWLSCPGDQTLIAVSTRDGRQLVRRDAAPFPVRALTWDSARQRLLGCAGGTVVGIDPAAPGSQVPQVVGGGGPRSCVALAYDAPTDALWRLTYRGLVQVVRLSGPGADGAQPRAVAPRCGLDGLALGRGDAALLSDSGDDAACGRLLLTQKPFTRVDASLLLGRTAHVSLACDGRSFHGTSAVWTLDRHDVLRAIDVGRSCDPGPPGRNHPPAVTGLLTSRNEGLAPARVALTASAADPDGDRIVGYEWSRLGGGTVDDFAFAPSIVYGYPAGVFHPAVRAIDAYGARSAWRSLELRFGGQPLAVTVVPDAARAPAGTLDGYTITIANPNAVSVGVGSARVHLPQRFVYVPGSTSGIFDLDPYRRSPLIGYVWGGHSFVLAPGGRVQFHFQVRLPATGLHAYKVHVAAVFEGTPNGRLHGHFSSTPLGLARGVAPIRVTPPPGAPGLVLTVTPTVASPGTHIRLGGQGFAPGETVDVAFAGAPLSTAQADATGSLGRVGGQVPASALPGVQTITAVGRSSGRSAQVRFLVQTDWPQFHVDAAHAGVNLTETLIGPGNAATLRPRWTVHVAGSLGSPVVAAGILYVGSSDGFLYAFDADTGSLKWRGQSYGPITGAPAVAGDVVYVTSGGRYLVAFPAAGCVGTCAPRWHYDGFDGMAASPTVVGRLVYVETWGHWDGLVRVSALTDSPHCRYRCYPQFTTQGIAPGSTPGTLAAPTVDGDTVYLTAADGRVHGLPARCSYPCAQLWSSPVSVAGTLASTPALDAGRVVFGSDAGDLYVFDAATRSELGRLPLGPEPIRTTPALAGGVAYATAGSSLLAERLSDRALLWSGAAGGTLRSSPALANGVVYVGSDDHRLYAYAAGCRADGLACSPLWSADTGAAVRSSPAVVNGLVYVGNDAGTLVAYGVPGR